MLYRICKRLIERGQTAGLADKTGNKNKEA